MLLVAVLPLASCGDWSRIVDVVGGGGGGGGSGPPPPGPKPGAACWANRLPPEVQPIPPKRPAAESCEAVPTTTSWTNPGQVPSPTFDARDRVVGRWIACGEGRSFPTPHAGIELGANGRWQLLDRDAAGALVPVPPSAPDSRGSYSYLSSDQLNLWVDGHTRAWFFHLSFGDGMDLARFLGEATSDGVYARTEPSPSNGRDNLPSISDGRCSMVGNWDLAATDQSPPATFSFDDKGNFVGGPPGSDLCAAHTMYGTYRLAPGRFELTENVGMGQCAWWFATGLQATFDDGCNTVALKTVWDNCTGGRGFFNGETVLTRRR